MATLTNKIKTLEWICEPCNREGLLERKSDYADGLCDGANGAATIAVEADELIQDLIEALSMYVKSGHGMSTDFCMQGDARQSALYSLDKYRDWKESNND